MAPGRELDLLVAEKIFKHPLAPHPFTGEIFIKYGEGYALSQIPEYSTDIAEAWQVVEKIKEFKVYDWMQVPLTIAVYSDGCHVGWVDDSMDDFANWHHEVTADTAPHAICLAALKAYGVEF